MMEFEERPNEIKLINDKENKNKINVTNEEEVEKPDFYNVAQQQIEEYKQKHNGKEPEGKEREKIMKNVAKFEYKKSDGSWGELHGVPISDGSVKSIEGFGGKKAEMFDSYRNTCQLNNVAGSYLEGNVFRFGDDDQNALIFKECQKSSLTVQLNQKIKSSGNQPVPCVLNELENMGFINTVSVNFTDPSDSDHVDVLTDNNKELFHKCAKDTDFDVDSKMDNDRGLKRLFTTNQADNASKNVLEFWNQTQHLQKLQTAFDRFYEAVENITKDYVTNGTGEGCLTLFDKNDTPTQFLVDIKLAFKKCFAEIKTEKELEDGFDKIIRHHEQKSVDGNTEKLYTCFHKFKENAEQESKKRVGTDGTEYRDRFLPIDVFGDAASFFDDPENGFKVLFNQAYKKAFPSKEKYILDKETKNPSLEIQAFLGACAFRILEDTKENREKYLENIFKIRDLFAQKNNDGKGILNEILNKFPDIEAKYNPKNPINPCELLLRCIIGNAQYGKVFGKDDGKELEKFADDVQALSNTLRNAMHATQMTFLALNNKALENFNVFTVEIGGITYLFTREDILAKQLGLDVEVSDLSHLRRNKKENKELKHNKNKNEINVPKKHVSIQTVEDINKLSQDDFGNISNEDLEMCAKGVLGDYTKINALLKKALFENKKENDKNSINEGLVPRKGKFISDNQLKLIVKQHPDINDDVFAAISKDEKLKKLFAENYFFYNELPTKGKSSLNDLQQASVGEIRRLFEDKKDKKDLIKDLVSGLSDVEIGKKNKIPEGKKTYDSLDENVKKNFDTLRSIVEDIKKGVVFIEKYLENPEQYSDVLKVIANNHFGIPANAIEKIKIAMLKNNHVKEIFENKYLWSIDYDGLSNDWSRLKFYKTITKDELLAVPKDKLVTAISKVYRYVSAPLKDEDIFFWDLYGEDFYHQMHAAIQDLMSTDHKFSIEEMIELWAYGLINNNTLNERLNNPVDNEVIWLLDPDNFKKMHELIKGQKRANMVILNFENKLKMHLDHPEQFEFNSLFQIFSDGISTGANNGDHNNVKIDAIRLIADKKISILELLGSNDKKTVDSGIEFAKCLISKDLSSGDVTKIKETAEVKELPSIFWSPKELSELKDDDYWQKISKTGFAFLGESQQDRYFNRKQLRAMPNFVLEAYFAKKESILAALDNYLKVSDYGDNAVDKIKIDKLLNLLPEQVYNTYGEDVFKKWCECINKKCLLYGDHWANNFIGENQKHFYDLLDDGKVPHFVGDNLTLYAKHPETFKYMLENSIIPVTPMEEEKNYLRERKWILNDIKIIIRESIANGIKISDKAKDNLKQIYDKCKLAEHTHINYRKSLFTKPEEKWQEGKDKAEFELDFDIFYKNYLLESNSNLNLINQLKAIFELQDENKLKENLKTFEDLLKEKDANLLLDLILENKIDLKPDVIKTMKDSNPELFKKFMSAVWIGMLTEDSNEQERDENQKYLNKVFEQNKDSFLGAAKDKDFHIILESKARKFEEISDVIDLISQTCENLEERSIIFSKIFEIYGENNIIAGYTETGGVRLAKKLYGLLYEGDSAEPNLTADKKKAARASVAKIFEKNYVAFLSSNPNDSKTVEQFYKNTIDRHSELRETSDVRELLKDLSKARLQTLGKHVNDLEKVSSEDFQYAFVFSCVSPFDEFKVWFSSLAAYKDIKSKQKNIYMVLKELCKYGFNVEEKIQFIIKKFINSKDLGIKCGKFFLFEKDFTEKNKEFIDKIWGLFPYGSLFNARPCCCYDFISNYAEKIPDAVIKKLGQEFFRYKISPEEEVTKGDVKKKIEGWLTGAKSDTLEGKTKFDLFLEGYKLEAFKNKGTAQKFIEQYPDKVTSNDVLEMARNGVSLSRESIDKLDNLMNEDIEVVLDHNKPNRKEKMKLRKAYIKILSSNRNINTYIQENICKESEKDKINEIKESDKNDGEEKHNEIKGSDVNGINKEANERAEDIEIKTNEKAEKIENEIEDNEINVNGIDDKKRNDEIKDIAKLMVKNEIVITKATRDGLIGIGKWCVFANEYQVEAVKKKCSYLIKDSIYSCKREDYKGEIFPTMPEDEINFNWKKFWKCFGIGAACSTGFLATVSAIVYTVAEKTESTVARGLVNLAMSNPLAFAIVATVIALGSPLICGLIGGCHGGKKVKEPLKPLKGKNTNTSLTDNSGNGVQIQENII